MEEVHLEKLKQEYVRSIMTEDLEVAVTKGEIYYRALHHGELTLDNREQIQNDIFMMKLGRE